jgi:hypothetical protein
MRDIFVRGGAVRERFPSVLMQVYRAASLSLFLVALAFLGTAPALLDGALLVARQALGMPAMGFYGQTVASLICANEAGGERAPDRLLSAMGSGVETFALALLGTRALLWAGFHVLHQLVLPFAHVVPVIGMLMQSGPYTRLCAANSIRTLIGLLLSAFVVIPFSSSEASDFSPIMDLALSLPPALCEMVRGWYLWALDMAGGLG